jgi:hypothetical protein
VLIHILNCVEAADFQRSGAVPDCRHHPHIGRRKADELVAFGEAAYLGTRNVLIFNDAKAPHIVSTRHGPGVQWTRWGALTQPTATKRPRVRKPRPGKVRIWKRIGLVGWIG